MEVIPNNFEKITAALASALEEAGYQNARKLLDETIIPLAREKGLRLVDAAWEYADQDAEMDTSWWQLWNTLQGVADKLDQYNVQVP